MTVSGPCERCGSIDLLAWDGINQVCKNCQTIKGRFDMAEQKKWIELTASAPACFRNCLVITNAPRTLVGVRLPHGMWRLSENLGDGELIERWRYSPGEDTAVCPHGNPPADCAACDALSDFAYDSAREMR